MKKNIVLALLICSTLNSAADRNKDSSPFSLPSSSSSLTTPDYAFTSDDRQQNTNHVTYLRYLNLCCTMFRISERQARAKFPEQSFLTPCIHPHSDEELNFAAQAHNVEAMQEILTRKSNWKKQTLQEALNLIDHPYLSCISFKPVNTRAQAVALIQRQIDRIHP